MHRILQQEGESHERREQRKVLDWREDRLDQAADGRLAVTVPHEDVLCLPPD